MVERKLKGKEAIFTLTGEQLNQILKIAEDEEEGTWTTSEEEDASLSSEDESDG